MLYSKEKANQYADYPQENISRDSIKQMNAHQTHNRLRTSISDNSHESITPVSHNLNSLGIIFGISEGDFTQMDSRLFKKQNYSIK